MNPCGAFARCATFAGSAPSTCTHLQRPIVPAGPKRSKIERSVSHEISLCAARRFSSGRVVHNADASENIWATASELGTSGRPLNCESLVLPLSRDIIVPENLSPEGDLKQAERQRPSTETSAAQKGVKRWEALLRSALTMPGTSFLKGKVVVLLNITGYIEDAGCAVPWTFGMFLLVTHVCMLLLVACFLRLTVRLWSFVSPMRC